MQNKEVYISIINKIVESTKSDIKVIQNIIFKHPINGKIVRKSQVLDAYKKLKRTGEIELSTGEEIKFLSVIQMKKVRTISGVTPVTVLTKPYPCPGNCIFCPSDISMPKSYLRDEPGAQRAEKNVFDPYLQTYNRLVAYNDIGHPTEKVELIVLGGTWSVYPESYQIWFIKRCFEAMNNFFAEDLPEIIQPNVAIKNTKPGKIDRGNKYNKVVFPLGNELGNQNASWKELLEQQEINETAKSRCVGMSLETRPDFVTKEEIIRIRKLGATKIQIGIQSLDDEILKANKRGHSVETSAKAVNLLRQAGYKIHAHWMPNLYGASPEKDIADFKKLFNDKNFKPDELKIYPCSLIENSELMDYYEKDLWNPYSEEELLYVLKEVFQIVPRYCRVTRVIRDISSHDIVAGNKKTNFRQIVEQEMTKEGLFSQDIRAREIRNEPFDTEKLQIKETQYDTAVSKEYFIEYITPNDQIIGFLRLSLPKNMNFIDELSKNALIREVHIYGQSQEIGKRDRKKPQHIGLGTNLIERAKQISSSEKYLTLSVISSVGTRGYYRNLGFKDGSLYQHLTLS